MSYYSVGGSLLWGAFLQEQTASVQIPRGATCPASKNMWGPLHTATVPARSLVLCGQLGPVCGTQEV